MKLNTYKQYDPTHTTTLRNLFVSASNRRFNEVITVIRKAIVTDDCFALNANLNTNLASPGKQAFAFPHSADKINAFNNWLDRQINAGILEIQEFEQIGTGINGAWTNRYISDSYKRGVMRARYELRKNGYAVPSIEETGGIDISMTTPFHIDRLGLLYTRTYNELNGITKAMSSQISRILTQGIADGDGPVLLARKIVGTINGVGADVLGLKDSLGRFIPGKRRAVIMARTEMIRAHHQAMIQEYKNWELEGVHLQAEFTTAGDGRVCEECAGLEGTKYTLEQAEGIIPVHPQCFIDPQIPIYTSKGFKPIGKIKVGDLVLTHKKRFRKVIQLHRNDSEKGKTKAVRVYVTKEKYITVTENHPLLIQGKWVKAKDLKVGDELTILANHTGKYEFTNWGIESLEKYIPKKKVTLYNFSVEEDESYIAKGIVVHNCRCIMLPYKKGSK